MPKKYNKAHFTKPTVPVHPSLSSSSSALHHDSHTTSTTSVNDLIQHLRRTQAPSTAESQCGDANPRPTVHPSLKEILQVPDTPGPRPRMQFGTPRRGRGPAGPPPPRSWLVDSVHAPKSVRERHTTHDELLPRLDRLPGLPLPPESSLMHQAFKALARNWVWHMSYDQYYLPTLQARHKELLLAYIAVYGPRTPIQAGLDLIFLDPPALEDATGSDSVTHLDLSGAAIRDLASIFAPRPASSSSTTAADVTVPDSWDTPLLSLPRTITPTRFPSLTHLSLAHPRNPSWRSLLAILPHLAPLTHLSLASWPPPTLTPNALTASTTPASSSSAANPSSRPSIPYSGSSFYTAFFGDWPEAASVLRRLSRGTLCLKWLDLEGCVGWLEALLWQGDCDYRDYGDEAIRGGVEWCGPWRGVQTIRVGQGWVPDCIRDGAAELLSDSMDDQRTRWRLLLESKVSTLKRLGGEDAWCTEWDVEAERRKYREGEELMGWLAGEVTARRLEKWLQKRKRGLGFYNNRVVFEKTAVEPWVETLIENWSASAGVS